MFNKTVLNESFSQWTIDEIWEKGFSIPGKDPNVLRKDNCGATIQKSEYGNTSSVYGWEIDHIKPKAKDGQDNLENLQPLQWGNNRYKGDNWPEWSCRNKS